MQLVVLPRGTKDAPATYDIAPAELVRLLLAALVWDRGTRGADFMALRGRLLETFEGLAAAVARRRAAGQR